jgi:hypothetical protein
MPRPLTRTAVVLALLAASSVSHADGGPASGGLAEGSVTYRAIAPNSVTNSKIVDGAITDAKLGFGAVTTPKIADGAVTDGKILGPISGWKIGQHGHDAADIVQGTIDTARLPVGSGPGTVAAGDHTHEFVPKKPATVIVVAPDGGDFANPIDAINTITDASADKPYLLKIMPGTYDLGIATLVMKEHVDVEGSGELTTRLLGSAADAGVVAGASRAELRSLSIEAAGAEGNIVGIFNGSSAPRIRNVSITVQGGKGTFGIYNMMAEPILDSVTVTAHGGDTGFGVFNIHSSPLIRNAAITAGNGVYTTSSGSATVEGSVISSTLFSIFNDTATTTRVANTRLEGGKIANTGIIKCAGVYDAEFNPVQCR